MIELMRRVIRSAIEYFHPTRPIIDDEAEIGLIELGENDNAPQPIKSASTAQILKHLGSIFFAKENMPRLGVALTLTICGTGFNFLSPYIFGKITELMNSEDKMITINGFTLSRTELLACMMTSYTLAQIIPSLREYILTPVNYRNTKKIILKNTDHLLLKSLPYHIETEFPKKVYFMQKGFAVSSTANPLLTQIAPTTIEIIIACSVLSKRYGLEVGLGLLGVLTVYTIYSGLTAKPIIRLREESLKAGNAAYQSFCDAIANYKIMYDFDKYNETINNVERSLDEMITRDIAAALKPIQVGFGHTAISRIAMLLGILFVGINVNPDQYTTEDFIVLVGYLNSLATLLPSFGQAINQVVASYPDAKFVVGELLMPDEVIDPHPSAKISFEPNDQPAIEFDNVTYYYRNLQKQRIEPSVTKNLSFIIQPGERIALVGESGTGKSTLLNLIYRYSEADEGCIKINGQDISKVSLHNYRQHIVLIDQKSKLIKGTIADNIRYGLPEDLHVTHEEIMNLAESVNLSKFIKKFPEGLNTDVGEAGQKLSGGQQQKVAILRGLMKPCHIRLLDEITAPFDGKSAVNVLQGLFSQPSRETTIMITHKLTETQWADRIIVLGKDYSITTGTHKELLENCEIYRKLWSHCVHTEEESSSLRRRNHFL